MNMQIRVLGKGQDRSSSHMRDLVRMETFLIAIFFVPLKYLSHLSIEMKRLAEPGVSDRDLGLMVL